jgi:pimeloyl-ACP methyl ester carboxylesterase
MMIPLLIWLFIIVFLFLCTCVGFSFVIGHRQKQQVFVSPAEFGLEFEDVKLRSRDGIHLVGWWIPAQKSTRTILLLHGYGGTYDPDLKYVPAFHTQGFNVLIFDFRAHGRSGGRYTTVGALEKRDCLAAIDYALQRGSSSIGLMGFSMGGRVALLSAPYRSQVKAVLSDCGPARLMTVARVELLKRHIPRCMAGTMSFMTVLGMSLVSGINVFRQEPLYQVKKLSPLPVLFIYGGHDAYTHQDELERMVSAAGPNAECWLVPEAGHRDIDLFRPEEYNQKVMAFFERWLPKE